MNEELKVTLVIDNHDECTHIKGTQIQWKEGKNLCEQVTVKMQKHKRTGKTRKVKKTKKTLSFFHLFRDRSIEEEEDMEEDDVDDVDLEYDIEGVSDSLKFVRDYVTKYGGPSFYGVTIPAYEDTNLENFIDDDSDDDDYEDVEEGEEEDDSDSEPSDHPKKGKKKGKKGKKGGDPANPDCKQQ